MTTNSTTPSTTTNPPSPTTTTIIETRILKVPLPNLASLNADDSPLGRWRRKSDGSRDLSVWEVPSSPSSSNPSPSVTTAANGNRKSIRNEGDVLAPIREAAHALLTTPIPVAFPTETVYGLGADATRSDAVRGIYAAKGRPSDNPLIVHVCDLTMLRRLLKPDWTEEDPDPIPPIYHPLISKFWPGPLTILLPLPEPSPLAPEVTAHLSTFGARLPASPLARSLIALTNRPLAAPSANASTRPSPTTAQHVRDDLDGRISLVLDGGPCDVGVESTVVDGLSTPPAVLRPGGVGVEEIRGVGKGWERVVLAWGEVVKGVPRAPGMKYKHYSPKARVVLFERGAAQGTKGRMIEEEVGKLREEKTVGIIRTGGWEFAGGSLQVSGERREVIGEGGVVVVEGKTIVPGKEVKLLDVDLGQDVKGVAHGLFAALRALDGLGADVIYVEGVEDRGEDLAAAVMNRLRKAASEIRA